MEAQGSGKQQHEARRKSGCKRKVKRWRGGGVGRKSRYIETKRQREERQKRDRGSKANAVARARSLSFSFGAPLSTMSFAP